MSDPLTPPPRRPLPPEVRDRIRSRVTAGLVPASVARMNRLRAPLAAAASVAVLAAGAAIVAQSVGGNGGGVGTPTTAPTTTSGATLDRAKANAELDRCWAAVRQAGKAGQFPDRSKWRPVMNYGYFEVHVTAARAAGKPLFCETTPTTVTVSDPNASPAYAPGTRTGAVLISRLGTVAGVVDPSWPWMWVQSADGSTVANAPATVKDGLFQVFHSRAKTGPVDPINVIDNDPDHTSADWAPLPSAPPPAVSIVDRPTVPAPDRTSDRGRALDDCLEAAEETLAPIDTQSWEPGAILRNGDDYVVAARNAHGFAACWQTDGRTGFSGYVGGPERANGPGPMPLPSHPVFLADRAVVQGIVPPRCVKVQVVLADDTVVEADVANSTFAALMPAEVSSKTSGPTITKSFTFRLYDLNNQLIFEGLWGG